MSPAPRFVGAHVRRVEDPRLIQGQARYLDDVVPPGLLHVALVELDRTVTPTPVNPLGAKGVGEAGAVGAPVAVVNAVLDALAPFGVEELPMPLRPEKIWAAIRGRVAAGRGRDAAR